MTWSKVNLVTIKGRSGMYDLYRCSECGYEKKYYGLVRDLDCPLRMKQPKKHKIERRIVGGWHYGKYEYSSRCNYCNSIEVPCPKSGHPNSKFWNLKRSDKEILTVCPRGCFEDGSGRNYSAILLVHRKSRELKGD